jgi:hypothetical protein
MKNNDYRKEFGIDEFARKYYCEHARLNQLRSDKKQAKRKSRRNAKKDIAVCNSMAQLIGLQSEI